MISFAEFLAEKWKLDRFTPRFGDERIVGDHHAHIDGHHVHIAFGGSIHNDGHFSVNYAVDGSHTRRHEMTRKTGQKILHHVNRKISQFVRRVKPSGLSFHGNSDSKERMYETLAKHYANRFGGETTSYHPRGSDYAVHHVHFPNNSKHWDTPEE